MSKEESDDLVRNLRRRINTLSKRDERQKKKIKGLNDLVLELKEKHLIEREPADILERCFDGDILDLVRNEFLNQSKGKEARRYSDTVKQFAMTVFYYSPQAYEYCRTMFCLPGISTLRNWLSNISSDPGFLTNVMDCACNSGEANYCLMVDSMSIRKQTMYENGKVTGFCDYGGFVGEDTSALASEALVFLIVPLNGPNMQYPIGYFLIDKICASVQAELIKTALTLTAEKGLRIASVTCDGCPANISTLKMLGANLSMESLDPSFPHPTLPKRVFATLDICHMLKLGRNALADSCYFVNGSNEKISWEFIYRLNQLQDNIGLQLANKVTNLHINWQKAKMKVKLAAQVLSQSVADALVFLHEKKVPGFEECLPTAEFIRQVMQLFQFPFEM